LGGGVGGLDAKDVDKEMFPVYGEKCLSRKAIHNWVKKRGKRFAYYFMPRVSTHW
jgi:hypothetical protein